MSPLDLLGASAIRKLAITLLLLASSTWCAAEETQPCADDAKHPPQNALAPYSVSCAGRSECSSVDQLEIKPVDGAAAKPLASVCLRLAGSNDAATVDLRTYRPPASSQVAMAHPLAPLVERWLRDEKLAPILRKSADPKLRVDVILVDADGVRFKKEVVFDFTAQWGSGSLPLNVGKVEPEHCPRFDCQVKLPLAELAVWKRVTKGDPTKLNLMISGTRLPGVTPDVSVEEGKGWLSYQLPPRSGKPETADPWRAIVKRALDGEAKFTVGLADDKGVVVSSTEGGTFDVPSAGRRAFASGLVAFLLAVAVAVWAPSAASRWLRDTYGIPDDLVPVKERSFSLGRCQMLWWTLVVAVSWFAIGYATGDWLSINESAVVVMGISAATAAGAVAVTPTRIAGLVQAYEQAKKTAAGNANDPPLLAAKAALEGDPELRTKGLCADLLSDFDETAGLHRFQNLLFTLAFGLYFAWTAFHEGAMPSLSATVLALMGISGSTYVGFKLAGKAG